MKKLNLKMSIGAANDIPAFAAFCNYDEPVYEADVDSLESQPKILVNFQATLAACAENDIDFKQFFAESVVHEMLHCIEEIFEKSFDDDRVESAIEQAREYIKKGG